MSLSAFTQAVHSTSRNVAHNANSPDDSHVHANTKQWVSAVAEDCHYDKIKKLAYKIAQNDGFQSGKEQEYWLKAEAEICSGSIA